MALSNQRERFCQAIALKGLKYSAAYSEVYDVHNLSAAAINTRASELANKPEIVERITVLRNRAADVAIKAAAYTLDMAISEAEQARALAHNKGQASAAATAVKLKAQLAGHIVEKKEVKQTTGLEGASVETLAAMKVEIEARIQRAKDAAELTGSTNVVHPTPARRLIA